MELARSNSHTVFHTSSNTCTAPNVFQTHRNLLWEITHSLTVRYCLTYYSILLYIFQGMTQQRTAERVLCFPRLPLRGQNMLVISPQWLFCLQCGICSFQPLYLAQQCAYISIRAYWLQLSIDEGGRCGVKGQC